MKEPTQLTENERMETIKALLKARKMTQQDFATAVGRPLDTINRWIHGRSIPELTPVEFLLLRSTLECSFEDLAVLFPGESRRRAAIKASHRDR